MRRPIRLLVTCEHGGHRVPARYRALFGDREELLASHAGYDVGALELARDVARAFAGPLGAQLIYSTTTRLLVDLNRSIGHRRLHSAVVNALGRDERAAIVARHHAPYRAAVVEWIEAALGGGARVLHLSCHSFTPVLDGRRRDVDIGLLFDPARASEAGIARAWRDALGQANRPLRVRFNQPYRGTSDGLTTALRRVYPDPCYAGIELEVNQRHPTGDPRAWRALRRVIVRTFGAAAGVEAGGRATNGPVMGMESRAGDVPARRRRVW